MPFADNSGARLHWTEVGEGSPLLLVMGHGYSSAMWWRSVPVLAEHHRVITLDNRGTGKSSDAGRLTIGDMACDAFAVLDAAGADSAHLYGVSMGGAIVQEMARTRPDRVRSLVLGCTMAKTPDKHFVPPLLHLPAWALGPLLALAQGTATENPYGSAAPADRVAQDEAVRATDPKRTSTSVAQSRAIARFTIEPDALRALTMPALVLHGDEDQRVPYAEGIALHELLTQSEFVTLPGAGHNYFTAAGEHATNATLDFLRRADATVSV